MQHDISVSVIIPVLASLSFGKVYAAPAQGAKNEDAGPQLLALAPLEQTAGLPSGPISDGVSGELQPWLKSSMLHPLTTLPPTEQVIGTEYPST